MSMSGGADARVGVGAWVEGVFMENH
jgi:hypothetical protein